MSEQETLELKAALQDMTQGERVMVLQQLQDRYSTEPGE